MKTKLMFDPKSGATPDEVMHVLKVICVAEKPPEVIMAVYASLPDSAKRHFSVKKK